MLKALLLQTCYGLSNRELAEALCDRLSFRRSCGFALDEASPDDTTLCRYCAIWPMWCPGSIKRPSR